MNECIFNDTTGVNLRDITQCFKTFFCKLQLCLLMYLSNIKVAILKIKYINLLLFFLSLLLLVLL